jgi:hypothetical protein
MSCEWWSLASLLMLAAVNVAERREVEIDDIIRSYNDVVSSVKTWEGMVAVYSQDGDASRRLDAQGTFAWDAVNDRRHCRLGYASRRGSLSPGKEAKWEDHESDRETVVRDGIRTEVWHNLEGLPLQHFKMPPDRPARHSVPTAKRDHVDSQSLYTPNVEFCPEYLFRGNLPPIVQLLSDFRDRPEEADSLEFRLVSENEFHIEATKGSFYQLLIMTMQSGQWVPHSFQSKGLGLKWQWSEADGVLIPVRLQVESKEASQRKVYVLSENRVNREIAETRFDVNAMAFAKGTLLEDVVDDVLLEHDGEKFAILGDDQVTFLDHSSIIKSIGFASLLFGSYFVCRAVVRQVRGRQ